MKKLFPYVHVNSVDEYFDLPKEKREKRGIYLLPLSLPCNLNKGPENLFSAYDEWSERIRKAYPIQGYIRAYLFDYDNLIYGSVMKAYWGAETAYYNVKRFFFPCAPRFRKAWPRHQYKDICDAIVDCNLALLLDFWEKEIVDGHVDWESDEKHKEFYDKLQKAMTWAKYDRHCTENEIEKAYDMPSDSYTEVIRLESYIRDKDTEVLLFMVENRNFFWT
jgi:hypothetical protein